jgi:hypothetical protein
MSVREAREVLSRLWAEACTGDPGLLVRLGCVLGACDEFGHHSLPPARLMDRITQALERGELAFLSRDTAASRTNSADQLETDTERKPTPGDFAFEGRDYRFMPADRFREPNAGAGYEAIRFDVARTILARLAAAPGSSPARRAELEQVASLLEDGRNRPGALFLLRRITIGSFSSSGPSSEPATTPSQVVKTSPKPQTHDLLFEYTSNTGHPIVDDDGFELVSPDGTIEQGTLTNGKLDRKGVEPGSYELRVRAIKGVRWSATEMRPFEEVELVVETKGFPDGTKVDLFVRQAWAPPSSAPLVQLSAQVTSNRATAPWKYDQAVGAPDHDRVYFQAVIGKKRATSDSLAIAPHPLQTPRGAQERLRALGYDPGAPSDTVGAAMKSALESYQKDHPPLVVSGTLDEFTAQVLEAQIV